MIQSNDLYICDQLKCENCSAAEGCCLHTSDITHAANFVQIDDGIYMETELKRITGQINGASVN